MPETEVKIKEKIQDPFDPYKKRIKKLEDEIDQLVVDNFEFEKIINIAIYHLLNGRSDKAYKCLKPYRTERRYDIDSNED